MIWRLAWRQLAVHPRRAGLLLAGYATGVAVMIVLLSVGEAMLAQSRDVSLVSGGEVTILPEGVDVEALRTGGLAGMASIDRARFVGRQMLAAERHPAISAVSPVIEQRLLRIEAGDTTWTVRAGADLPTIARALGAGIRIVAGTWGDSARDAAWRNPGRTVLYHDIDRFHRPGRADSTWAEWHYFNVVVSPDEWWYVTLLVGGDIPSGRYGGQVLVTRRTGAGHHQHATTVSAVDVRFDTLSADVSVGDAAVTQRDGVYRVRATTGPYRVDLQVTPRRGHYFPPIELGSDSLRSGYAVAAASGVASGTLCVSERCRSVAAVPAYHDHNWGTWRDVTWEWGSGQGNDVAILYGGVRRGRESPSATPHFLALFDAAGLAQVYRFGDPRLVGSRPTALRGVSAPDSLVISARRGADSLVIGVAVIDAHATLPDLVGTGEAFVQMRGRWRAVGTVGGRSVTATGEGFFETWVPRAPAPLR